MALEFRTFLCWKLLNVEALFLKHPDLPHYHVPVNETDLVKTEYYSRISSRNVKRHGTTTQYFLMYLWGQSCNEAAPKKNRYFKNSPWPQLIHSF